MTPRPNLAGTILRGLDWRAALREPRTWGILARHMIPVAGVLALGWSGIQAVSVVALDTLAGLWCVVAVASIVVAREQWWQVGRDLYSAVIGGVFVFVVVAGLLTFMVGVVVFVLGGTILQHAEFDPRELLDQGWIYYAFAGLLVLQAPHGVAMLATTTGATAKSVFEPRVGFLLRRLVLALMACSSLSFLWGKAALLGALVVSQIVLAAHEVFGERLHAFLFPEPAATAMPAAPARGRRRRKRRA